MSEGDSTPEQSLALRRGLSIRIGIALAVLAGVAILAVVALTRSGTDSSVAPAAGATAPIATAPIALPQQPEPSTPAPAGEAAQAPAIEAAGATPASELKEAVSAPAPQADKNADGTGQASSATMRTTEQASATSADKGAAASTPEPAIDPKAALKSAQADAKSAQADAKPSASGSAPKPTNKPVRGPRLQAGVFLQATNAQTFKANLEAQGFPVYIESRVHIGPFRDRKEAERAREKLRELGVTTVLIAQ
ncbi:MAG: SPOR domain-containing protein [Burkholderiales bacterium]